MLHIGTSGYNYPEWKGSFYPDTLPSSRMLGYYADRFSTVEINYTFYRMPTEKVVAAWAAGTPDRFSFALKAPRRITHDARLRDCADAVTRFCTVASSLGDKQAPLLFQLPPNFKKDLPRLNAFLDTVPERTRAAFEFRHPSWLDDDVFEVLRSRHLALCVADSEKLETPVVVTADYTYFRLRDEGYTPDDISAWAGTIRRHTAACRDVYVYFKHEEQGKGPEFAAMLRQHLGTGDQG
jgi:uncharacterized protein YecE (DUF72 family)